MSRLAVPLLLLFFLAVLPPPGTAATPLDGSLTSERPILINSDRLVAEQGFNKVSFIGNVVARQGDVVIYAQELTLFYRDEGRQIDRVEAYRDVRIVQGPRVATGQKGVYYGDEGKIVLTGSPRVHQGESFVEGEEIILFLHEEKSLVRGGGDQRVNAVFQPQKEEP